MPGLVSAVICANPGRLLVLQVAYLAMWFSKKMMKYVCDTHYRVTHYIPPACNRRRRPWARTRLPSWARMAADCRSSA